TRRSGSAGAPAPGPPGGGSGGTPPSLAPPEPPRTRAPRGSRPHPRPPLRPPRGPRAGGGKARGGRRGAAPRRGGAPPSPPGRRVGPRLLGSVAECLVLGADHLRHPVAVGIHLHGLRALFPRDPDQAHLERGGAARRPEPDRKASDDAGVLECAALRRTGLSP